MKRTVVITQPQVRMKEADAIAHILDEGCWRVHVRKPDADKGDLRRFLDSLCAKADASRLSVHYYPELVAEYSLGGLHGGFPRLPGILCSRSCHTVEEVRKAEDFDYLFISPVFDSISKEGYKSLLDPDELRSIARPGVVALGGIDENRLAGLDDIGFSDIALLGAVWRDGEEQAPRNFRRITERWR